MAKEAYLHFPEIRLVAISELPKPRVSPQTSIEGVIYDPTLDSGELCVRTDDDEFVYFRELLHAVAGEGERVQVIVRLAAPPPTEENNRP